MKIGFSRVDITPFRGVGLSGYYELRRSDGFLDPLYATVIALNDGERTALLMTLDVIGIPLNYLNEWMPVIAADCSVEVKDLIIACTHTHTGPEFRNETTDPFYNEFLLRRLRDAAVNAVEDLTQATLSAGQGTAADISFIRRFRMKDGSTRTNPGINNPEVDHPIGEPDTQVQTVYVSREGKKDLLLVNFQVHPDVIGGTKFSADYPGFLRSAVETLRPDLFCAYFNGCQGDTNHVNVNPPFGKRWGGYAHAESMGRILAGVALGTLDHLIPCEEKPLSTQRTMLNLPIQSFSPEDRTWAEKYAAEFDPTAKVLPDGRRRTMEDMALFTRAQKILDLKNIAVPAPVCGIAFNEICFVSMPGEPFTEIGRQIKAASAYKATFLCCCANGYQGYFPTPDAFNGGYEALSSVFERKVAEVLIEAGKAIVTK